MKLFIYLLFLSILPAKDLTIKCRVVAVGDKLKVHKSRWISGEQGCTSIRHDAEFSQKIFGDVLKFGIQIRGSKQSGIMWLRDNDPGADKPHIYVLPVPPEDDKPPQDSRPKANLWEDNKDETGGRLAPSN